MISDEIIDLLGRAAELSGDREFSADLIDGGIESIDVSCEEDYLVAMTYIAECYAFSNPVDL
jgi:hypothetical protein